MHIIDYHPPATVKRFIRDFEPSALFYDWIVGAVGSGKTTGLFFKLVYMAGLQAPSPDGIRRTRAVIVRNTMPQLKDTTLVSWGLWFKDGQAGKWNATDKIFTLRFGDVECEVMFRPLDTPDDVRRVLSLEVTFVILDEFVEIPQAIVDALGARVGRYKQPDGTRVTNWGMWGASNPSTEDNWWFDYLHNKLPENAKYFIQPSALGPAAENLDNLPGKPGEYYSNLVKGKSQIWINQFVHAEWGFSISGTPVVAGFNPLVHIAKSRLNFNPMKKLLIGFDPGLGGSALIFGQEDYMGKLSILGELVQRGMGAERIVKERLRPYISERFPGADVLVLPDPAAAIRAQSDEKTVTKVIGRYYKYEAESNNRLPLRLDGIDYFVSRLVEGQPALQVDPFHCPNLIRALKGGWRYAMDTKKDTIKGAEPEDNQWTHPGDAFGYLCRYLHKKTLKAEQYSAMGVKPFASSRRSGPHYHMT